MRRIILVLSLLMAVFAFISAYSQEKSHLDPSIKRSSFDVSIGS
jgi:hypothetical protein